MRCIRIFVFVLVVSLITVSCSTPAPQSTPLPENTAAPELTIAPVEATSVVEEGFDAGIQSCRIEANTYPLDHKEPGWNTFMCSFWVLSDLSSNISEFLVFEDEADSDSKSGDLRAHEAVELGIFVTTDAQVNYPVDVFIEPLAMDSFLQKGIPLTSNISFQDRETGGPLPHSFYFVFNLPESVTADEIVLTNSGTSINVPPADVYTNTIPPINREFLDQVPEFEHKDSLDIAYEGSSFSYGEGRLYLKLNYLVSNLDKTTRQEGAFTGYRIYDPNGYYWYPETEGGNLAYSLDPEKSAVSSLRFSTPYDGIPDVLYIVPKGGSSDPVYPLDTGPIEVTNCKPISMKNLSERWVPNRPEFFQDRLANMETLEGPGPFDLTIRPNYSTVWKLVVGSRKLITLTITGNYLENTYFDSLYLPDGQDISAQMTSSRIESPENNVTIIYSFAFMCDGSYYLLDLNNFSYSQRNITLTVSAE